MAGPLLDCEAADILTCPQAFAREWGRSADSDRGRGANPIAAPAMAIKMTGRIILVDLFVCSHVADVCVGVGVL